MDRVDGTIPPRVLREFCEQQALKIGILFGWDGKKQYVVTWGDTPEESDMAATTGNRMKTDLGWPPELCAAESPKVAALRDKIKELESRIYTAKNRCSSWRVSPMGSTEGADWVMDALEKGDDGS